MKTWWVNVYSRDGEWLSLHGPFNLFQETPNPSFDYRRIFHYFKWSPGEPFPPTAPRIVELQRLAAERRQTAPVIQSHDSAICLTRRITKCDICGGNSDNYHYCQNCNRFSTRSRQ